MSDPNDDARIEILKAQLAAAIETFRFALTVLIQMFGFFTAANAALLVYAFDKRSALGLLVASTIPMIIALAVSWVSHATVPVIASALATEAALAPSVTPLVSATVSHLFAVRFRSFDRASGTWQGTPPWLSFGGRRVFGVLVLASAAQLLAAIAMWCAR